MTNEEIIKRMKESPFQKQHYEVSLDFNRITSLNFHILGSMEDIPGFGEDFNDLLKYGIPKFQRDNNKWSKEMQVAFIENVVEGYRPTITLFTFDSIYSKISYSRCWILDGLQRLTAIIKFLNGELKAFGRTYEELKEFSPIKLTGYFEGYVRIYRFRSMPDVIDFYIDINKNITHSKEDIQKAKNYKDSLTNETFLFDKITMHSKKATANIKYIKEIDYGELTILSKDKDGKEEVIDTFIGLVDLEIIKKSTLEMLEVIDKSKARSLKSKKEVLRTFLKSK